MPFGWSTRTASQDTCCGSALRLGCAPLDVPVVCMHDLADDRKPCVLLQLLGGDVAPPERCQRMDKSGPMARNGNMRAGCRQAPPAAGERAGAAGKPLHPAIALPCWSGRPPARTEPYHRQGTHVRTSCSSRPWGAPWLKVEISMSSMMPVCRDWWVVEELVGCLAGCSWLQCGGACRRRVVAIGWPQNAIVIMRCSSGHAPASRARAAAAPPARTGTTCGPA